MAFLFSCKQLPPQIENLNQGKIIAVGHGGPGIQNMFSFIPLNTKSGFEKALKNPNLMSVEMDVQMSADNKLVLFHDEKLEGKTNGKGKIVDHTFNELIAYKYATAFYNFGAGNYPIVALEEMLTELKSLRPNGTFVLDLKLYKDNREESFYLSTFAVELVNVINRTNTGNNVCIESMNLFMLQSIQKLDSTLKLFLYTTEFENGINIAAENKFYGVTIKYTKATKELVKLAHNKGLRVSLWGPRTKMANTKNIQLQPDYIQTDKISDLVQKVKRYP